MCIPLYIVHSPNGELGMCIPKLHLFKGHVYILNGTITCLYFDSCIYVTSCFSGRCYSFSRVLTVDGWTFSVPWSAIFSPDIQGRCRTLSELSQQRGRLFCYIYTFYMHVLNIPYFMYYVMNKLYKSIIQCRSTFRAVYSNHHECCTLVTITCPLTLLKLSRHIVHC